MKKTSEKSSGTYTYQIKKQKPGFFNDGDGFVDIECLEDKTKNLHILQYNCLISNRQVIKLYEYMQKNPNPDIRLIRVVSKKLASYRESPDSELRINFYTGKAKPITVNMSDLPAARNVELMKALTAITRASAAQRSGRI